MDTRLRRVNKEIADCKNDKASGIRINLGGLFEGDIVIPDSYPFAPVKMKFITKVYHPNVSSASGAICLDILKDAWSPVLTLKSTLISLQSLLCSPEPNDPQDAEVAKHYTTSKRSFEETASYWTRRYAMPHGAGGAAAPVPAASKGVGAGERDEMAIAGLERAHVERFEALGFWSAKVVSAASFFLLVFWLVSRRRRPPLPFSSLCALFGQRSFVASCLPSPSLPSLSLPFSPSLLSFPPSLPPLPF
ncbi:ubiquitin-conjugating enzyme/RWD-like protein [Mycena sanguinolenta]|nr:ubiquitin-conjugating enzyme/RWD-like protein [Mycena sanguinolenta]